MSGQIHAHEIFAIIADNKVDKEKLRSLCEEKFGKDCTYTNCSGKDFSFDEIIDFMVEHGKIVVGDTISLNNGNICNH